MGERDGEVAGAFGLLALVAGMAVPLVAERARDDYDSVSQFISELGERGTPDGALVSWAGFVPVGLLAIGFGVFAWRALRAERRLAWSAGAVGVCFGLAYVVSAFARCEPGCPSSGDVAQTVHNLVGGALGYLGAGVGMAVFGLGARRVARWRAFGLASAIAGLAVLVASGWTEQDSMADHRGMLQRLIEIVVFGWMLAVGGALARPRSVTAP